MFKAFAIKLADLAGRHLDFVKKAFSDSGQPSSARLLSIPHAITSIFGVIYMLIKTGGHPDAMAITALSGFAVAPYTVNKVSGIFKKDDSDKKDGV